MKPAVHPAWRRAIVVAEYRIADLDRADPRAACGTVAATLPSGETMTDMRLSADGVYVGPFSDDRRFDKISWEISFLIDLFPTNTFPALGLGPMPSSATALVQKIYCYRLVCRESGF